MARTEGAWPLTIAVAGAGDQAARWLRALRGVDGVTADRVEPGDADLLHALSDPAVEAVAFAGEVDDLAGAIKRALAANRHVFVAGATAIGPKQLLALDVLARRRARVIIFDTGTLGDERVDFARRMTAGPQALWRPRYIRSLRTGAGQGRTLDELAIADVQFVMSLIGGGPSRISAVSPRVDDETGGADVAMITLMFDGGSSARIDVSLIEHEARHEVTIACDGRTLVLDAFNARAPLRIIARGRHRGPERGAWNETVSEHPAIEGPERTAVAAGLFAGAVRGRDLEASNAQALAAAAAAWEAARASIARGGEMIALGEDVVEPKRPTLRLIMGGGHFDASYPAPELTVVGARSARRAAVSEPLESA